MGLTHLRDWRSHESDPHGRDSQPVVALVMVVRLAVSPQLHTQGVVGLVAVREGPRMA
jgi:hypothetical protein